MSVKVEFRKCLSCGNDKPCTNEYFSKCGRGLLRARCKTCTNAEIRQKRANETDEQSATRRAASAAWHREWRRDNPDKVKRRPSSEEDKERRREANRRWYWSDPERARAFARRYGASQRDKKVEAKRRWRANNPEKQKRLEAINRERRRSDPKVRLHEAIGLQVWFALKGKKCGVSWTEILGYSRSDLVAHLERQFKRGMSWENYGSYWHVDHIQPKASFRFNSSSDPEFKACWALSNLRPLEAKVNMSKGAKRMLLV